jgi:hypothetical protein
LGPSGHYFAYEVSPYVIEDDPSSGLLPGVHDEPIGQPGQGDGRIQAYNYRMCLTHRAENRVPFPKPTYYDPMHYELLLRTLLAGSRHVFGKFDPIPNRKTDTNNHGPFSTDNIGANYEYPEASYERRREILAEHLEYQQGYLYFLANDPRVPEDVRERYTRWGLAKDEFADNGHWPYQIYVREARRMVSDFVVTELHLTGKKPTEHSVGMGSYNFDSHHTQRYIAYNDQGRAYVQNEGDVQVSPAGRIRLITWRLFPSEASAATCLCLCAIQLAYRVRIDSDGAGVYDSRSIGGNGRCLAIDAECPIQEVDYDRLRQTLLKDGSSRICRSMNTLRLAKTAQKSL